MALFDGVARGIGAAALGYGQGTLKGEAEGFRRQNIAEDRAARKALLELQKKKLERESLDPSFEQKTAAQLLQGYTSKWNTPEGIDHLRQNPALGRKVKAGMANLAAAAEGRERLNPDLLNVFDYMENDEQPVAPAGPPAAPPTPDDPGLASRWGLQPGQAPFDKNVGAPQSDPLASLASVQSGGPESLHEPLRGIGGMPQKPLSAGPGVAGTGPRPSLPADWRERMTAPPPAAAPTPATPATTPSQDPMSEEAIKERMRAIAMEEPRPKRDTEPASAYQKYLTSFSQDQERRYKREERLLTTLPKATILGAQAGRAEEIVDTNIGAKKASTGLAREQTRASQVLLPGKKELQGAQLQNFASQMRTRAETLKQGWDRLDETQRHNKAMEEIGRMNADTNKARQLDTESYHEAMKEKISFTIDHFDELELGKDDRAILNYAGRVLTAQQGIGPIRGSAAGSQSGDALQKAEGVFKRIEGRRQKAKKGTPTVTKETTRTTGTRASAGGSRGEPTRVIGGVSMTRSEAIRRAKANGLNDAQTAQALKAAGFPK